MKTTSQCFQWNQNDKWIDTRWKTIDTSHSSVLRSIVEKSFYRKIPLRNNEIWVFSKEFSEKRRKKNKRWFIRVHRQRFEQEEKLVLLFKEHFSQFDALVLLRIAGCTMEKEKSTTSAFYNSFECWNHSLVAITIILRFNFTKSISELWKDSISLRIDFFFRIDNESKWSFDFLCWTKLRKRNSSYWKFCTWSSRCLHFIISFV